MKRGLLFAVIACTAVLATAGTERLRFMTFNIWGDYFGNPVEERQDGIHAAVERLKPDLLSLQEVTPNWWKSSGFMAKLEGEYGIIRGDEDAALVRAGADLSRRRPNWVNHEPLLYRKDRLRLLDSGVEFFHMTLQPEKSVTWGVFEDLRNGKRLISFATHLWWQYNGEESHALRELNVRLILCTIARQKAKWGDLPVIGGGDLNCNAEGQPALRFFERAGYSDAGKRADVTSSVPSEHTNPTRGADGRYRGEKGVVGKKGHAMLDRVFYTKGIRAFRHDVVCDQETLDVSDHSPVVVDFAVCDGDLVIYDGEPKAWGSDPLVFPGPWDLSSHGKLEIEVTNTSAQDEVRLSVELASPDDSRCRTAMIPAGFEGTIALVVCPAISHPEVAARMKGMRTDPFMGGDRDAKYDSAHIPAIALKHHWTATSTASGGKTPTVLVRRVVAKKTTADDWPDWYRMDAASFFPFIDIYGQFKFRDWPRKVRKDADLRAEAESEKRDLAAHPGIASWSRFGGWARGPRLEATGRFRLEKLNGKWWFVDPDGFLWWSHGVVRVSPSSAVTPLDGREDYFDGLPEDDGVNPFAQFYHTYDELLKPYYDKRGWKRTYDFSAANLKRKYGDDWRETHAELSHLRLRSWGLNTVANSSDRNIRLMNRTPWIERIETRGPKCPEQKGEGWWHVPDPYHPEFRRYLREQLEARRAELTSPWCVGIFVDNEHDWEGIGEKTVREYFKVIREEIKRLDPQLLYFGCRFAGYTERIVRICADYADVISYNPYRFRLDGLTLPSGVDRPILIGEFHFGSTSDTGLFNPSLVQVSSQSERAKAYRRYVTDALVHPNVVGTHWHQFADQPTTGRFDGENFNVGFTDVCDTPYPEMRDVLREVGEGLYDTRFGKAGTIAVVSDYPCGNVKVLSVDAEKGVVEIAPDLRDTVGHWFHFDFTVCGAEGKTLKFRFPQDGMAYLSSLGPAICRDGKSWTWLNADGRRHEPDNAFAFAFGKEDHAVRFAVSIPYGQKEWEDFTARWRQDPRVRFGVLCKSHGGTRDVELLRVPCQGKAEYLFVFTARHHACETTGNPPMEGALRELLSDSDEGRWAREHAECVFVPFMDKDGVENGDQGKNRTPWDHNRDYTKGRYASVRAVKDLILRESEGRKIVFLDLHSPYVRSFKDCPEQDEVFTIGTEREHLIPAWNRFRKEWTDAQRGGALKYDGTYDLKPGHGYWAKMKETWDSGVLSSDEWVRRLPNTALSTCCEFGYSLCGGVNSREAMRELGSNMFKAVVRAVR